MEDIKKYFILFKDFIGRMKRVDWSKFFTPDLTNSEYVVLDIISDKTSSGGKDSVWVSEIVDEVPVTAQAISKCLRSLENKGYVERFSNREDRRMTGVRFLPYGKEVYETAQNEILDFTRCLYNEFEKEEREEFIRLSDKFANKFIEVLNEKTQQNI